MERKIGEIFEYKGEWYQCVNTGFSCADCDIKGDCSDTLIGPCTSRLRKDGKQAKFKKLEKVGVPYISSRNKKRYQLCRCFCLPIITKDKRIEIGDANFVGIEVKQNKEDMEENENNRTNCPGCGDNRFEVIARAKAHLLDATNIASNEKEMAVIDNILFRCYQMGWLKGYEQETPKPNLKPFDLEAAKVGKPVCTRDGRKARIVCFDVKSKKPILALIENKKDCEFSESYYNNGCSMESKGWSNDLMMTTEKKEGWLNLYPVDDPRYAASAGCAYIYRTREQARAEASGQAVTTVKVEWEE